MAEGNVNSTFLVVGDRVIAGTNDSTVVAVDVTTGALVQTDSLWWVNPHNGRVEARWARQGERALTVAIAGDLLVTLLQQEVIVGFKEVYRVEKQGFFSGVLSYSTVTGCIYDARIGEFHIVDPTTGERLCTLEYGERGFAETHPCAANGHLYILSEEGDVLALRHPDVRPSGHPVG